MKITKIIKLKEKYKIILENKAIFYVLPGVFEEFNLYINKDISESEISKIKEKNGKSKYLTLATKKLNLSSCSPKKIKDFLYQKGASKDEINYVLTRLRNLNFLNEESIVEEVLSYCNTKHYGYNKIIKLLNDKCLSKESIKKIEYDLIREEREAILLTNYLKNKLKNKNNFQLKKAILNSLINHGFSLAISSDISNKVFNSNETELNMLKLDYSKAKRKFSKINDISGQNKKIIQYLISKGYKIETIRSLKEIKLYEMD